MRLSNGEAIAGVGELMSAAVEDGKEKLTILHGSVSMRCVGVSQRLQEAWNAIEDDLEADDAFMLLACVHGIVRGRGCHSVLTIDGIEVQNDDREMQSIPVWVSPPVLQSIRRFASHVNQDISDAASLLLISGLQIRHLVQEVKTA